MVKKKYLCLKDWQTDSGTYFKQGNYYEGKPYNNGSSVEMYGEMRMTVNFHKDSEYFPI